MRVLTVRQPWAWAIIHAGKGVENRTHNLAGDYRGPVAIHAGLAPLEKGNLASRAHRAAHGSETPTVLHFGGIIGVVDLVGVHHFAECVHLRTTWQSADPDSDEPIEQAVEKCSDWAEELDVFHLELSNPRPLDVPIPFKGGLGLRRLDDATTARVLGGVR